MNIIIKLSVLATTLLLHQVCQAQKDDIKKTSVVKTTLPQLNIQENDYKTLQRKKDASVDEIQKFQKNKTDLELKEKYEADCIATENAAPHHPNHYNNGHYQRRDLSHRSKPDAKKAQNLIEIYDAHDVMRSSMKLKPLQKNK